MSTKNLGNASFLPSADNKNTTKADIKPTAVSRSDSNHIKSALASAIVRNATISNYNNDNVSQKQHSQQSFHQFASSPVPSSIQQSPSTNSSQQPFSPSFSSQNKTLKNNTEFNNINTQNNRPIQSYQQQSFRPTQLNSPQQFTSPAVPSSVSQPIQQTTQNTPSVAVSAPSPSPAGKLPKANIGNLSSQNIASNTRTSSSDDPSGNTSQNGVNGAIVSAAVSTFMMSVPTNESLRSWSAPSTQSVAGAFTQYYASVLANKALTSKYGQAVHDKINEVGDHIVDGILESNPAEYVRFKMHQAKDVFEDKKEAFENTTFASKANNLKNWADMGIDSGLIKAKEKMTAIRDGYNDTIGQTLVGKELHELYQNSETRYKVDLAKDQYNIIKNDNSENSTPMQPKQKLSDVNFKATKTRTAKDMFSKYYVHNPLVVTTGNFLTNGWTANVDADHGKNDVMTMVSLPMSTLGVINSKAYTKYKGEKIANKIIKEDGFLRNTRLITNGTTITGVEDADIIKKQFEKHSPKKLSVYEKVNFNSYTSTKKYTKELDNIASKMGLGNELSKMSDEDLEALFKSNKLTAEQAAIVNEIYNLRHIKELQGNALVEKIRSHGVDLKLDKIDLNSKTSIRVALNSYSHMLSSAGAEDFTKMSISELQRKLKKSEYKGDSDMIKTIISLKKQENVLQRSKLSSRKAAQKAYILMNKTIGDSDALQGAKQMAQIAKGTQVALSVANVVRKTTGKYALKTSKVLYRVTGAQKLVQKTETGRKIEELAKNTKEKADKLKQAKNNYINDKQTRRLNRKEAIKNKIKESKPVKSVKNKVLKIPGAKATGEATKKIASFFGAFADVLQKIKLYVIAIVAAVFLLVCLINGLFALFDSNSNSSGLSSVAGAEEGEFKKAEAAINSLFIDVYENLVANDNAWFTHIADLAGSKETSTILGETEELTRFNEGLTADGVPSNKIYSGTYLCGYYNPNPGEKTNVNHRFGLEEFGCDDPALNSGIHAYFEDNDNSSINKHANVKMCMSLAHGLIQGDYANCYDAFKEFSYGLWNNSHDYTYRLVTRDATKKDEFRYLYSCTACKEEFKYVCSEFTKNGLPSACDTYSNAEDYDSIIKVIDADKNKSGGLYDSTELLGYTGTGTLKDGCEKTIHENNSSKSYTVYNLINSTSSTKTTYLSNKKIDVSSLPSDVQKTLNDAVTVPTIYSITSLAGGTTKAEKKENVSFTDKIPSFYINNNCEMVNCTVVNTGKTTSFKCSDEGFKIFGTGTTVGCKFEESDTINYCTGEEIKVCPNPDTISSDHKGYVLPSDEKLIDAILAVLGFLGLPDKKTDYKICDNCHATKFLGLIGYNYVCDGHVETVCKGHKTGSVTCPGHSIPVYKIVCEGHYDCSGHTSYLCTGHMDLDITASIIGLDENNNLYSDDIAWDDGELEEGDDSILFWVDPLAYGSFSDIVSKVYVYPSDIDLNNIDITRSDVGDKTYYKAGDVYKAIWDGYELHWTDDMIGYVNSIYATDWAEVYGITGDDAKLDTEVVLSDVQIQELIKEYYPKDVTLYASDVAYKTEYDARCQILSRAYYCITRLPYYPGGRASYVGFANNDFGSLVRDANNVVQEVEVTIGKDKLTFKHKGLDDDGYVLWALSTGANSDSPKTDINTIIKSGKNVTFDKAEPGDVFVFGDSKGIYAGKTKIKDVDTDTTTEHALFIYFNTTSKDLIAFPWPIEACNLITYYKSY